MFCLSVKKSASTQYTQGNVQTLWPNHVDETYLNRSAADNSGQQESVIMLLYSFLILDRRGRNDRKSKLCRVSIKATFECPVKIHDFTMPQLLFSTSEDATCDMTMNIFFL